MSSIVLIPTGLLLGASEVSILILEYMPLALMNTSLSDYLLNEIYGHVI